MSLHSFKSAAVAASVLLLSACGGGGGGSSDNTPRNDNDPSIPADAKVFAITATNSKPLTNSTFDFIGIAVTAGPAGAGVDLEPSLKQGHGAAPGALQGHIKVSLTKVVRAQTETENCSGGGSVDFVSYSDVSGYAQYKNCVDGDAILNGRLNADYTDPNNSSIEYVNLNVKSLDGLHDNTVNGKSVLHATTVTASLTVVDNINHFDIRTDNFSAEIGDVSTLPGTATLYDSRYGKFELHDSRLFGENNSSLGVQYYVYTEQYQNDPKLKLSLDENGDGKDDAFAVSTLDGLEKPSNHLPPVIKDYTGYDPITVPLGEGLPLDGWADATDADGDFLRYTWSVTPAEGATLSSTTNADSLLTLTAEGSHTLKLDVTDGEYSRTLTRTISASTY